MRVLAYAVEARVQKGKTWRPALTQRPCDRHWDEDLDGCAPLTPAQRRIAVSLGFCRERWVQDDWTSLPAWAALDQEQQKCATDLCFSTRNWKGGGGPLTAIDTPANIRKKREGLIYFRTRAPSSPPEMQMDVLGSQLHCPKPSPPPRAPMPSSAAPPISCAVRTCVQRAISGVCAIQARERVVEMVAWFEDEIAREGLSGAVRYRRCANMPRALRELTQRINAMRRERIQHALERRLPLLPPTTRDGYATMGGVPLSLPDLYEWSYLPHTQRFGPVITLMRAMDDGAGGVRVRFAVRHRKTIERYGFVSVSQLLTERRLELAIDDPAVKATDVWDECATQEMHSQRLELQCEKGIKFERRYYHPFPTRPKEMHAHFFALCFCESHNMKTSGQNLAGLAGFEGAVVEHAHLLEVARSLAERDRKFAPLVASLQKAVDMQSQAVFGNLFSCESMLHELNQRGHWREATMLEVLGLRWRACDQRGMSRALRVLAIEVLDVLLVANICGSALFHPGGGGTTVQHEGHHTGVRSGFFQGMPWQTMLGRLSNDGLHGLLGEVLSPEVLLCFVLRTMSQNDLESLFGCVVSGLPTKPPPCLMEPNFRVAEFMDMVRNDEERAKMWKTHLSRRKKYDAVNGMESLLAAQSFCNGDGDTLDSPLAVAWQQQQEKGAITAAQGKQESARTNNVFIGSAKDIAAGGLKRRAVQG